MKKSSGLAVFSLNTYLLLHLFLLSPAEAWSASLACLPIPAYVQYNVPNYLTVTQRTWHTNSNVTSSEWVPACMYCSWDVCYTSRYCDLNLQGVQNKYHLYNCLTSSDVGVQVSFFFFKVVLNPYIHVKVSILY